ncbi:hypothetical protein O3M35_006841 [Rhynocoris fuscipes]|uniref:Cytosol aminopeptidase n=1 Tax=Rhynocoris fuscipes TaxID=488301 RepID=A0AAW1DM47_9HEMI
MAASRFVSRNVMLMNLIRRSYSSVSNVKKGLVLGAFTKGGCYRLTPIADYFDRENQSVLTKNLEVANLKDGKSRIIYKPGLGYNAVAVVGLGPEEACFNHSERFDDKKENIRIAAAAGCTSLQEIDIDEIHIEELSDAEASAEGATLGLWRYQEWKKLEKRKKIPCVIPYKLQNKLDWHNGIIKAEAQNLVRNLAEAPANYMTPSIFAQCAQQELEKVGVQVCIYDEEWAIREKMGSFLSVAKGSNEPLRFLEMKYDGGTDCQPIVLIGKGVTFDSGGISLKPSAKMDEMRGDMAGAACVIGILKAIAELKLPINVIGLTPLCENLPSGKANKPGDIVQASNGKYIQIDNTDAEGRLILADALCYAGKFDPKYIIDLATLTGAVRVALGNVMAGVFTNDDQLWENIECAGHVTGDRMWRLPLVKEYSKRVNSYPGVDVNNVGKCLGAGSCTAAAFLKEFVPENCSWMHIDIAGVAGPEQQLTVPYLNKSSTGRPTRTLIQFLRQIA